ncbi:MAG: cation transporter [Thermoanaerobaculia bacterium]|nr:cation transporter [Thermoanaerobaculia bacterium]
MKTQDTQVFASQPIRRVLWIVLGLNLTVAFAKLLVGWWTGTISMVADGFHSTTDSASNVVGLIGVALAARPPDENHPYGHGKFETLSALFIGGLLAMTAWEVLRSCLERLWHGGVPEVTAQSFAVMITTLAINFAVSTWERRRGDALASEILRADAAHTRSDVYVSLGVIASLVAVELGYPQVDLVAALVITAVIAHVAFQILRQSAGVLVDPAVVPAEKVREVALAVPGVLGVHKVRTRGQPQTGHADLHVQVRPDLRLDQAHVIGHLVSDRLREVFGFRDVVTHVEPPPGHRTDWHPDATT